MVSPPVGLSELSEPPQAAAINPTTNAIAVERRHEDCAINPSSSYWPKGHSPKVEKGFHRSLRRSASVSRYALTSASILLR